MAKLAFINIVLFERFLLYLKHKQLVNKKSKQCPFLNGNLKSAQPSHTLQLFLPYALILGAFKFIFHDKIL